MLSFREESFGDQVKFGLCLLFLLYLVVNYIRWQMITTRLHALEDQLKSVEGLARTLLEMQQRQGGGGAGSAGASVGAALGNAANAVAGGASPGSNWVGGAMSAMGKGGR